MSKRIGLQEKKKQYSIEALLKLVHLKYIFVSTPIVYEKKKKKGKGQKKKTEEA